MPADIAAVVGPTPAIISTIRQVGIVTQQGANDSTGSFQGFFKSRKSDGSADTIVQNGDEVGQIGFFAADGAAYRPVAFIHAYIDGTPGASDMPGRLDFQTVPDGSATPAIRWTIKSTGDWLQGAAGGNIVFTRDSYGLVDSPSAPAAAGSTITDATVLTAVVTFITAADGTKGVKFGTTPIEGQRYVLYNTANAILKVYPGEAGDQINAAGAGVAINLAAYAALYCHASSASQLWCGEMANP